MDATVNRRLLLKKAVVADDSFTTHGDVNFQSGSLTVYGLAWPSTSGSLGDVLSVGTSPSLRWAPPVTTYTRQLVTTSSFTMSSSATVCIVQRPDAITTITLPAIASAGNFYYMIADDGGSFAEDTYISVGCAEGETIAGESEWRIYGAYNSVRFFNNGTNNWLPS